jgi:long-subunit fatty acid transport protein
MPESTSSGVSASMSDEADIPDELACITAHPAMFTKAEVVVMKQV